MKAITTHSSQKSTLLSPSTSQTHTCRQRERNADLSACLSLPRQQGAARDILVRAVTPRPRSVVGNDISIEQRLGTLMLALNLDAVIERTTWQQSIKQVGGGEQRCPLRAVTEPLPFLPAASTDTLLSSRTIGSRLSLSLPPPLNELSRKEAMIWSSSPRVLSTLKVRPLSGGSVVNNVPCSNE